MGNNENLTLLRKILQAIGLSQDAIDDLVQRINDLLTERKSTDTRFPYAIRDHFLSSAEQKFYLTLKEVSRDWAVVYTKVSLNDIFYAKTSDPSEYRICTNKIDRKHIDFLLCDPLSVQPILGVELDDKTHQRTDRKERDEFVASVFAAAKLPLARVTVKQNYNASELGVFLRETAKLSAPQEINAVAPAQISNQQTIPACPKCNGQMVLRTAKSGANQGQQFWGCVNYPRCHGIRKYETVSNS